MQDLAADPGASDADRARVLAEYNAFVELAGRGSEPLAADVSEEVRDARNLLQEMSRAVTAHTEGRSVDPAQVAGFVQRVDELAAQGIPREGLAPPGSPSSSRKPRDSSPSSPSEASTRRACSWRR